MLHRPSGDLIEREAIRHVADPSRSHTSREGCEGDRDAGLQGCGTDGFDVVKDVQLVEPISDHLGPQS